MLLTPESLLHNTTATSIAITKNSEHAATLIASCSTTPHKTNIKIDNYFMSLPPQTTFVGHLNTDLDSIASSVGAAFLFNGVAASASSINSETLFALSHWNIAPLPLFESLPQSYKSKVCLMDHNQTTQFPPTLTSDSIVGVIDHHALQEATLCNDRPIYVDIRPWGSSCTIVAHTFFRIRKTIPKNIAGLLLSGILSDTLNLRSPTTTPTDKLVFAVLAKIANVDNADELADSQFKAKSSAFAHLSPYEIACGDQKVFNIKDKDGKLVTIGFGVCKTTDPIILMNRADEIMVEVAVLKAEQKLDFSFLAVVDVINLSSKLLLIGLAERELAELAFEVASSEKGGDESGIGSVYLADMVSRKKDFIPALTSQILSGVFSLKKLTPIAASTTELQKSVNVPVEFGEIEQTYNFEKCCTVPVRRLKKGGANSPSFRKINDTFASVSVPGGGWSNLSQLNKNEQKSDPPMPLFPTPTPTPTRRQNDYFLSVALASAIILGFVLGRHNRQAIK